jgi:hypothetical protein
VDLATLTSELQIRGFSQENIDTALRCLLHVYAVQDFAADDKAGVLADDIIGNYPVEVVQAAIQIFLDKGKYGGNFVYRVRWGFEDPARTMLQQLWEHSAHRWDEYVANVNERYIGFFLAPMSQNGRVITAWGLNEELRWFCDAIPGHGWNVMRIIEDVTAVSWELDLAFGFRSFGEEGIGGEMALLHESAFEALQRKALPPPEGALNAIKLWKFFSEYDVKATDFVTLMLDCGLTLEQVTEQVDKFFAKNLSSHYREGQYPPYYINDKKKKEFKEEVRLLLHPMEAWLTKGELPDESPDQANVDVDGTPLQAQANSRQRLASLVMTLE